VYPLQCLLHGVGHAWKWQHGRKDRGRAISLTLLSGDLGGWDTVSPNQGWILELIPIEKTVLRWHTNLGGRGGSCMVSAQGGPICVLLKNGSHVGRQLVSFQQFVEHCHNTVKIYLLLSAVDPTSEFCVQDTAIPRLYRGRHELVRPAGTCS
jgi:hypothetical protein